MNNPYSSHGSPSERAKSLLSHYFGLALGDQLNGDCYAEIGDIVDCILKAFEEETTEFKLNQLQNQVDWLQRRNQAQHQLLETCVVCLGFALRILKQEDTSPETLQGTITTSNKVMEELQEYLTN